MELLYLWMIVIYLYDVHSSHMKNQNLFPLLYHGDLLPTLHQIHTGHTFMVIAVISFYILAVLVSGSLQLLFSIFLLFLVPEHLELNLYLILIDYTRSGNDKC